MTHIPETSNQNGDQIKVGATGTVSSLMSRELESIKESAQASPPISRKKLQDPPVSVPCGYSPRRSQPRRSSPNDASSSGSNSVNGSPADSQRAKPKARRNEHKSPMLATAGTTTTTIEKNATSKEKLEKKKKGHTHIVEVVDLKCNNPMSSRLKKLGFSKLSESVV